MAKMKTVGAIIFLLSAFACKKSSNNNSNNYPPNPPPPPVVNEWKFDSTITWSDEFSNTGVVDNTKWSYDVGGNGWGNNELEYYTSGLNDSVKNGILYIIARKENYSGKNYTSARIVSKNKGDWTYGRFEIQAKLLKGRGTWPAVWMLPTYNAYGGWPNSGEIDIMEHVGYDLNNVHFTLHAASFYGGNGKGGAKVVSDATDAFHRYRLDWAPYGIRGFVDDEQIFEYPNQNYSPNEWPYNKNFHLLMNLAIGGSWGGAQGVDDSIFPTMLQVDYVRIYKFLK
jgi:beta-glucanase (GH16 family)